MALGCVATPILQKLNLVEITDGRYELNCWGIKMDQSGDGAMVLLVWCLLLMGVTYIYQVNFVLPIGCLEIFQT